ncbi:MAG: hypothetical protein ACTSO5_13230 [Candidatus Heimdallarchaeaceae archaeon]
MKFILRIMPLGCLFVVPTKISVFDIIMIILLCVFSIIIFIYFILNDIQDEKSKIFFLNLRLVNVILSLLGLFYLLNWFDKFCIQYRFWVSIYSYIAVPSFLALPFLYIIVRGMKQDKVKAKKFSQKNVKIFLTKIWKTTSFISYESLLVVLVILFYYTLPFFYPYTNLWCSAGLEYKAHYSTILFVSAISLISIISLIKPIISKNKRFSDVFPVILLRLFTISMTLLGRKYFVSYQYGNCIDVAQKTWGLISSTTWIVGISIVLFIVIYCVYNVRNQLLIHKRKKSKTNMEK